MRGAVAVCIRFDDGDDAWRRASGLVGEEPLNRGEVARQLTVMEKAAR